MEKLIDTNDIKIRLQEEIEKLSRKRLTIEQRIHLIELLFKFHKVVRSLSSSC